MNPIGALFWKEARESAYKIAACAGLALIVGLVFHLWDLSPVPRTDIYLVSHLVGLSGAVLMGIDAIARERSGMTLPYLLCRPIVPWKILTVKFSVGAAGLLAVLASYWGGAFIELQEWGIRDYLLRAYSDRTYAIEMSFPVEELLSDVGYIRVVSLWFLIYLIPYGISVLASILSNRPLTSAITSLMAVWVGLFLLVTVGTLAPQIAVYYFRLVFTLELNSHAGILRQAFDPSLVFARVAATALLVVGTLLFACNVFRVESSRRFQWVVGTSALICAIVVIAIDVTQSRHRRTSVEVVAPVGSLSYKMNVSDLALKNGLAVVLLEQGLSVVDVTAPMAPVEIGRLELEAWRLKRLALSSSRAYAWCEMQDSVGVAVFDLSRPDHPVLQALSLLYPVEVGPAPWLRSIPRLVGWGVSNGYLYAGLLGDESLELCSFHVGKSGPPPLVHALPIEDTINHVWNHEWEMRIVGPRAFMTLGHDFAVLNLTDSGRTEWLSRTPLRRFGRAVNYEKLVREFREQVTSAALPEPLAQKFEEFGPYLRAMHKYSVGIDGRHVSVVVPPGLGPLTVWGDIVYIERSLPLEIAVVDISDPRKPEEVDHVPWTSLPRRMTTAGASAYAIRRGAIQAYVTTGYGAFSRREKLGFVDRDKDSRKFDLVEFRTRKRFLPLEVINMEGEYIYALLNNKLAIFENPRKTD